MYNNLTVTTKTKKLAVWLGAVLLISLLLLGQSYQVRAEGILEFYTDSSGINVKAGESLTFNLYASDDTQKECDVALSIKSMPEGFTGFFKRSSYEVSRVHVSQNSDSSIASFQVTIPKETPEGKYDIVLQAETDGGKKAELPIVLNITELESGESNFTVEYPEQEGVTGTAFSYTTTLANNTLNDQTYNFTNDAPSGWQVTFKSDSTQVSSLDVESGSSKNITITVTPPEKVDAGEYEINCSASSAKESMSTKLKVTILGTYGMEVTTSDGRLSLDANANKGSKVTLRVTNTGNIDLENINMTSSAPSGWNVTFNESTIDILEAGATKEIQATITPDSNALTGDYLTYITASTGEHSAKAEFRITVKTQTVWGAAAIAIIIAVVAGIVGITRKFGRR